MTEILPYGNVHLRTKAKPVTRFDDDLRDLFKTLTREMRKANGVGLSANQIGVDLAACVIDVYGEVMQLCNPEIWDASDPVLVDEGCLSIPDYTSKVLRWGRVDGRSQDISGNPLPFVADGLYAQAMQHEVDHLNGMLYIDRLSPEQQSAFRQFWWGTYE